MTVLRNKRDEREAQCLALRICRTAKLLDNGLKINEIAHELNQPESSVRKWVSIIREARKQEVII